MRNVFNGSRLAALGILGLAACGGDSDELDLSPYTIDTRAGELATGALVAHDDGTGWKAGTEAPAGVFTFTPTDQAVTYAVVCPASAASRTNLVQVRYETLRRERIIANPCPGLTPKHDVEVTVVPSGSVVSARRSSSWSIDDTHTLLEAPGTADLVVANATRVAIVRGAVLPPAAPIVVDLDESGAELDVISVELPAAAAGTTIETRYAFVTAGGTVASLYEETPSSASLRVVPASLTGDGDRHVVEAATTSDRGRSTTTIQSGSLADLESVPPFAPQFESVATSWDAAPKLAWTGRPDSDNALSIAFHQSGDIRRSWLATVSAERLELDGPAAAGEWSAPDIAQVAGWNPAWDLDRLDLAETRWTITDRNTGPGSVFVHHSTEWSGQFDADGS